MNLFFTNGISCFFCPFVLQSARKNRISMTVTAAPLNHYLTDNIEANYRKFRCKEVLFRVAAIASYVALALITTAVFVISCGVIPLTAVSQWLMGGALIAAIGCGLLGSALIPRTNAYATLANTERAVLEKWNAIRDWDRDQIINFLTAEGIRSQDSLTLAEPASLLRGIARYQAMQQVAEEAKKKADDLELRAPEHSSKRARIEARTMEWERRGEQIKAALNCAIIGQILQTPVNQHLELIQPDGTIPNMGSYTSIPFGEALYNHKYEPDNRCLTFMDDLRREPLTQGEVLTLTNIDLRRKIFP
jgi:hypothetical protein